MFRFLTIFTMLATIIVKLNTNLNFKRMFRTFGIRVVEDLILKGWTAEEGFKSQSQRMLAEKPIRFVQTDDNRFYWIQNGDLYFSYAQDGAIDMSQIQKVELKGLSEDEVKELLLIMDALRK